MPLHLFLPELSLLNACETPKKATLVTHTHTQRHSYTHAVTFQTVNDARMCVNVHPPTHAHMTNKIHMHVLEHVCNVPLAPLIKCQCELCCCRDHRCTHGDIAFSLTAALALFERTASLLWIKKTKTSFAKICIRWTHTHTHTLANWNGVIIIRHGGEQ